MARYFTLISFGLVCLVLAISGLSAQPNPALDHDAKVDECITLRRPQPLFNGKNLLQITQNQTPQEIIALKVTLNLKDNTITKLLSIASLPPRRYRLVKVGSIMVMKVEHTVRALLAEDATEEEIAADILHSFYQAPLRGDQSLDEGAIASIKNTALRDYLKLHLAGIRNAPWSEDHLRLLLKGILAITSPINKAKANQASHMNKAGADNNKSLGELFPLLWNRNAMAQDKDTQFSSNSLINQAQQLLTSARSSLLSSSLRSKAMEYAAPSSLPSILEARIHEEKIKDESLKTVGSAGGDNNTSPPTSGSSHGNGISVGSQVGISDHFEMVDVMPLQNWQAKARLSTLSWAQNIVSGLCALILTLAAGWGLPEILVSFRWNLVHSSAQFYSRRLFG